MTDSLPPPPRPRRWLTALLCAVIFLAGGVVGAGATAIHLGRMAQRAIQHPEEAPPRIARRLQRKLDLSDSQAARIEAILVRRQAALIEARTAVIDQAEPELNLLESEIAEVLDASQAELWHSHYRRLRRDWLPPLRGRRPHEGPPQRR
jgi:hypothetical protein